MPSESQRTYLSPPEISKADIESVVAALRSGWVAPAGEEIDRFEKAVCDWTGAAHAIALSSGTAGLHLSLKAVGVDQGDLVLMPTLTFAASAFAAQYLGAEPAFVDVSLKDWQMDASLLEQALSDLSAEGKRVGAVLAVDLYGQCGDLCQIRTLCEQWNVPLVEDAAEAL
jgi:dTDP-4-amino-4,6-dideoxygalactose transaminase